MLASYEHHSPSSLNLFAAEPAMWVLERVMGLKQPVGVPAHRGVAVEAGVAYGLIHPDASPRHCIDEAIAKYAQLTALSTDKRREQYCDDLQPMVLNGLEALRRYGPPSAVQGYVEWRPDGLLLPIVGFYDFKWEYDGIVVDLKTTERMPSEIKIAHARQVSLYAGSDNMHGQLAYVTPKRYNVYKLENIREHRQALANIAKRVENILSLSDDPKYFLSITVPDLDSFYWTPPEARQLAFEHWGI